MEMSPRTLFRFDVKGIGVEPGAVSGTSLFLESLLEEYCNLYTKNEKVSSLLFEALHKNFSNMELLPADPLPAGIRAQYRRHLRDVFTLTMQKILKEDEVKMPVEVEVQRKCVLTPIKELPELYMERQVVSNSRFEAEYTEVEFIAKGGFGRVFRARHLLDENTYAVKTVSIKSGEKVRVSKTLREIQTLSRLHHPNVVSYKNAWLEVNPPEQSNDRASSGKGPCIVEVSTESDSASFQPPKVARSLPHVGNRDFTDGSDSRRDVFLKEQNPVRHEPTESSNDPSVDFKSDESGARVFKREKKSQSSAATRFSHRVKLDIERVKPMLPSLNLYIAMQFCDGTLREWLRRRDSCNGPVDPSVNMRIFVQILEGLQYIHDNGIIHRDLKPENIFFNHSARRVQIGDFGLARYLRAGSPEIILTPEAVLLPSIEGMRLTRGLGTQSYAAPEQMLGGNYGYKVDIYSLGHILVELFEKFFTDFGRYKCFQDLRNGAVPTSIMQQWPVVGHLAREMLDKMPELRPSASELYIRASELQRTFSDVASSPLAISGACSAAMK